MEMNLTKFTGTLSDDPEKNPEDFKGTPRVISVKYLFGEANNT